MPRQNGAFFYYFLEPHVTSGLMIIVMKTRYWKVGELAKAVNLSIRALHYYEEVGLLSPTGRNEGGHRLYSEKDVARLHQILILKELGLPLEEIRKCFQGTTFSPLKIVRLHKARIENEKTRIDRLNGMLARLEKAMANRQSLSVEDLINMMEVMNMQDKYLTKEQLKKLADRENKVGPELIKKTQEEWPQLIAAVRKEM